MKRAAKHITALATTVLMVPTASANVVGGDTQNFNPAIGTTEFVTVQSTAPTDPGFLHLGLFMNHAVNSLPYQNTDEQSHTSANDALTGSDAFIGFGLLSNLDLGVSFPFVINQSVEPDSTHGEFEKTGNTDIRIGGRYRFLQRSGFGMAALVNVNINRTENNPHTGADTSPLYSIELASDYAVGSTTIGANLGYRWREPGEKIEGSLIDPIQNQALLSLAVAQKLGKTWTATSEVYSAQSLSSVRNETDRELNIAEALLGARFDIDSRTKLHMGAGSELIHGLSSPDWRAYAGVTTVIGPEQNGKTIVSKKRRKAKPHAKLAEDFPSENPLAEVSQVPDEIFVLDDIHFEFDSDFRILPGGLTELEKLANRLSVEGYDKLIVEGHTDAYGSDEYNVDLSFRRARSVRRYLIKYHALPASGIMSIGYGEERPLADNLSDNGRQENRRVEIKIFK